MSKVSARHAVANNLERSKHVRRQLERRREVLGEWVANGVSSVPEGTSVPRSLNQVRCWDDARLGISPIGSPSSVTRTHRVHGAVVRQIDRLLGELAGQRAARAKGRKARAAKRKRRLAVLERSLVGAANRYAVRSVELDETQLRLRVAEQSFDACKQENSELRAEVRELKTALARRSASGNVTPIDLLRRDPP